MITEVMQEGVLEDLPAQERKNLMLAELTKKLERSENQRIAMENEYSEKLSVELSKKDQEYSEKLSVELSKKDRFIEELQKKLEEVEKK